MSEADERIRENYRGLVPDGVIESFVATLREERARVLEEVADASYSGKHPPRVTRFMRRAAALVREGQA